MPVADPPGAIETYAEAVRRVVRDALAEDVGTGDATTLATVPADVHARAVVRVKQSGVLAGLDVFAAVFAHLDPAVHVGALVADGARVADVPAIVAEVEGPARALLTGERTALNLLQRLSGVATATAELVALVEGTGARILDTRKTQPGLRLLEKRAVLLGGGTNHRVGLYDAVLIKDNHIAIAGGIREALELARRGAPGLPLEVEVRTLDELEQALAAHVERVLLDNMGLPDLRAAVALVAGRCLTEASGGVTRASVRAIAETGVDLISVGAITHSAPALDIALDVEP